MDNKAAASILDRVKREKEKRAAEGGPPPGAAQGAGIPLAALAAGLLAHGTLTGATYGGIAGAGYGSAKKRTAAGAGRGIVRGGLTGLGVTGGALGGAGAGLLAGSALGVGGTPSQQALTAAVGTLGGGLAGGIGGGVLGWKGADKIIGKDLEEKTGSFSLADPDANAFSGAVQGMAAGQLKSDALKDVASVGLGALGVGAAGRGLVGLIQMMRNGKKKTRSGPAYLPLPYPAEAKTAAEKVALSPRFLADMARKAVSKPVLDAAGGSRVRQFLAKAEANLQRQVGSNPRVPLTNNNAIAEAQGSHRVVGNLHDAVRGGGFGSNMPYPQASAPSPVQERLIDKALQRTSKTAGFLDGDMATTKGGIPWYGPAVLGGGLAGIGLGWKGMDKLLDSRRQREQQQELDQARQEFHDALLGQYDEPIKTHPSLMKKKGGDESTMEKVGKALDDLFDKFEEAKADQEKTAVDWSNLAGQAAGGYGMYAGLSGLLTGAVVYDKMSKRSRRAVLEKALQQRQRRKFMQSPTEIMAVPEPMPVGTGA